MQYLVNALLLFYKVNNICHFNFILVMRYDNEPEDISIPKDTDKIELRP